VRLLAEGLKMIGELDYWGVKYCLLCQWYVDEETHGKCEEDRGGELGVDSVLEERAELKISRKIQI